MKKKRNNSVKALILMLVLTMLALIALSGTYARYVTISNGTGTAVVAKWDISFKNGETDYSETFEIDLAETMTSDDSSNDFIQPGSAGSFTITVTNNSDVPATVVATVSDLSSSIFSKGQFTLEATGTTPDAGTTIAAGATQDVTVEWNWEYNGTDADAEDTQIGETSNGATKTICEITLSATQVNPNA